MARFKRKIGRSLQARLSVLLSIIILLTAVIGGVVSFLSAFNEANEFQDDELRQIASLINSDKKPSMGSFYKPDFTQDTDPESQIVVQIAGIKNDSGKNTPALPDNIKEGFHTVMADNKSWRLFIKNTRSGDRLIIGQQTAVRDEIARDSAIRTIIPFAVLIPLMLILLSIVIRRMFRPVTELSSSLDKRTDQDMRHLDDDSAPDEIKPFIASINRLLARIERHMEVQRRFVADAAHELRSPLTAVIIQAGQIDLSDMSENTRERLNVLRKGLQRMHGLLNQMLTMARVQDQQALSPVSVSVQNVLRKVLEDLMPLAEAKNLDIALLSESDVVLTATETDIMIILKNIIDNAIKYSRKDGHIKLKLSRTERNVVIVVEDDGPGISGYELERVFDPFYRIIGNDEIGSGLGLSIVKTITDRLGGNISLCPVNNNSEQGLSVTITLPIMTNF